MQIKDNVALVLGSIKGIGKAVGLDLAAAGAKVVYTYYDWTESLPGLEKDAKQANPDHLIVRADLTRQQDVESLMQIIIDHYGRLDILINNIERGGWPIVHGTYTQEQWDLEQATTLRAKMWAFNAALPHLKNAGEGVAVNFSSIAALVGRCGPTSLIFNEGYAAANRGISLLTETWARLGAPEVRVNEVMLGLVETRHAEETRGWGLLDDGAKTALLDHTLLGRTGRIEDVIKTVRFLVEDADFMTGAVIRLDGGYVLGGEKIAPMPRGVV